MAPPGWNLSVAVSMGAWGRGGAGAVRLYAQAADGQLQHVLRYVGCLMSPRPSHQDPPP